jgi:hypothetical protein
MHLRDKESLLGLFRGYHAKYQTGQRPQAGEGTGRDVFSLLRDREPERRIVRLPLVHRDSGGRDSAASAAK